MSELPKGWVRVTISDLADVKGGKRLPSKHEFSEQETKYPYLRVTDLKKGSVEKNNLKYISKETRDKIKNYTISSDDLYITIAGTIGLVGQIPLELNGANLTENAAKICNFHFLEKKYLMYFLQSKTAIDQFSEKITSSGQPKLALFRINDCTLGLAPQAEQTRIVEKLDEVLGQVDAIKTRLDNIPAILKRFRQSVLAAAVSGRLTNSVGAEITIEDIALLVTKGASPTWQGIEYVEDDSQTLFVTSENVGNLKLLLEKKKYLQNEFNDKQKRSILKVNDVLTNIVGASIGRAALWTLDIKANINQAVCVIRVKQDRCLPKYLVYFLNSPNGIEQLLNNKVDVARANVSLKNINELKFSLPSIKEQEKIIHRVEQCLSFADIIETQVKKAQTRVDNLTQSILAKAFRGELVAQDPNDEPAEKLLERIAQARKEAEALAKATKKVAKTK